MEYLDIVDEKGFPTGEVISRDIAHRDGILHRTAHVWVVRKSSSGYDILLQKRSEDKESFPGLYDTSSAGHIPSGVKPLPSALRELQEELGIIAEPDQLHYAGTFRIQYEEEFHGQMFRDNEVTRVYVYEEPVVIIVTNHSFEKDVMYILRHRVEHHIHDRFCRSDIIV